MNSLLKPKKEVIAIEFTYLIGLFADRWCCKDDTLGAASDSQVFAVAKAGLDSHSFKEKFVIRNGLIRGDAVRR